jgi:hypothetical protein
LVEDAELLLENGRHGSALALAILALEEVGKYYLEKWREATHRRTRRHGNKQQAVKVLDVADAVLMEINTVLAENGCELKHESELTEAQRNWLEGNREASWLILKNDESMSRIADAIKRASKGVLTDSVFREGLSAAKNKGIYVDATSDGRLWSSPEKI